MSQAKTISFLSCLAGSALLTSAGVAHGSLIDFEDLTLSAESYENGAGLSGSFISQGAEFPNTYDSTYGTWSGFAYSNMTSNTVNSADIPAGNFFGYQYESAAGGAAGGSNYAIAFPSSYGSLAEITLPSGYDVPQSISLTNSLYSAASMTYGDSFGKQFSTADEDFFKVTITGYNVADDVTGSTEFYLADFRDGASYIVEDWENVSLTALGDEVRKIGFSFESSDNGQFGINTPTYVAVDNLEVVPEPSTYAALAGLFALGLAVLRRRS